MQIFELKNFYESWAYVTAKNVGFEVLKIMKRHVGESNSLTKEQLISKIFNVRVDQIKPINYFVLNKIIVSACQWVRANTNCFIVSQSLGGTSHYFVLSNEQELSYYIKHGDNLINGVRRMQSRAKQSLNQKWYMDKWQSQNELIE